MDAFFDSLSMIEKLLIFGIGVGLICGLFPLILGLKNNKKKLAFLGLLLSLIGGLALGFIAAGPIAAIFTFFILKKDMQFEFNDDSLNDDTLNENTDSINEEDER